MTPAMKDALEYYQKQIDLARDRIRRFEDGSMAVADLGPPGRNTTVQAIDFEKELIATFQRGIDIIKRAS